MRQAGPLSSAAGCGLFKKLIRSSCASMRKCLYSRASALERQRRALISCGPSACCKSPDCRSWTSSQQLPQPVPGHMSWHHTMAGPTVHSAGACHRSITLSTTLAGQHHVRNQRAWEMWSAAATCILQQGRRRCAAVRQSRRSLCTLSGA